MPPPSMTAHPEFGNSRRLRARLDRHLTDRAPGTGLVGELTPRLRDPGFIDRCLGDPVVRSLHRAPADAAMLWRAAGRAADAGALTAVANEHGCDEPLRLGGHPAWLFRFGPGPLNQRLQALVGVFTATLPGPARLVDGRAETGQAITQAADLLAGVVPELAADALGWVRVIACLDSGLAMHSATLEALPGVVVLDQAAATDRLVAAELVFHEALHAKFDALLTTRPILGGDGEDTRAVVTAVWHGAGADGQANRWPVVRAISAFHVYAHLVAFGTALAQAPATAGYGNKLFERALFRALYLGRELLRNDACLAAEGVALVRWLLDLLPPADALPPEQRHLIEHGLPSPSGKAGAR